MQRGRPHVSQVQKEYLLKYLLQHPRLTNPKWSSDFTVKDAQMEWQAVANALNQLPGRGSVKNWKQWRKTWQDLKSKTKLKYHQQRGSLTKDEKLVIEICRESMNDSELLADEHLSSAEIDEGTIDKYFKICPKTDENHQEKISEVENIQENIFIHIIPSSDQEDVSGDKHMDGEDFAENQSETKETVKGEESDTMMDSHDSVRLDRQHSDNKKPNSTSSYQEQKLCYLKRIARAKERSAWAKVRIANALEKLAS